MTHISHTSTMHKTASLADEGNSAYCQSSGAHNIKHNLWKLALTGHLNTDAQVRDRTRNSHESDALTARPKHDLMSNESRDHHQDDSYLAPSPRRGFCFQAVFKLWELKITFSVYPGNATFQKILPFAH